MPLSTFSVSNHDPIGVGETPILNSRHPHPTCIWAILRIQTFPGHPNPICVYTILHVLPAMGLWPVLPDPKSFWEVQSGPGSPESQTDCLVDSWYNPLNLAWLLLIDLTSYLPLDFTSSHPILYSDRLPAFTGYDWNNLMIYTSTVLHQSQYAAVVRALRLYAHGTRDLTCIGYMQSKCFNPCTVSSAW